MENKIDILLHPVRMKIIRTLSLYSEDGLSTLELTKKLPEVPQATLYRHIQKLEKSNIITIAKQKKVRSVTEKHYVVNIQNIQLNPEEWNQYTKEEKLNYYYYFQLSHLNQYQAYLDRIEELGKEDFSTLSTVDLKMDDDTLNDFQKDLHELMMHYYHQSKEEVDTEKNIRTIGFTIIP